MSKSRVETNIFIPAPPQEVWAVLTDFTSYPEWNPFVRSLTGEVVLGGKINITVETPPGARAQSFNPKIISLAPNRELRWRGHLLIPNIIFTGEHYFLLEPENGGTSFTHGETFNGLLVGMVGIEKFTPSFNAMNAALLALVGCNTVAGAG